MPDRSPYTPTPAGIPRFLALIQSAGKPAKVGRDYLKSVGFKSGNDAYLISIFKMLGFLDPQGVPTDTWSQYRDKAKGRVVLATAIRRGYAELFTTYPDAYRRDNEALRNFFSTHNPKLGEATLQLVVRTFKVLCEQADFESQAAVAAHDVVSVDAPSPRVTVPVAESANHHGTAAPVININIALTLPATEDSSIYDKLFASLQKHLLS